MTCVNHRKGVLEEIAEFFSLEPTAEQILQFRPSPQLQARAEELAARCKNGALSEADRRELDQFEHVERLLRLTKARVHARKVASP